MFTLRPQSPRIPQVAGGHGALYSSSSPCSASPPHPQLGLAVRLLGRYFRAGQNQYVYHAVPHVLAGRLAAGNLFCHKTLSLTLLGALVIPGSALAGIVCTSNNNETTRTTGTIEERPRLVIHHQNFEDGREAKSEEKSSNGAASSSSPLLSFKSIKSRT